MKKPAAFLLILVMLVSAGCDIVPATPDSSGSSSSSGSGSGSAGSGVSQAAPQWGQRSKTDGCQVNGPYPDSACTPGDILPDATKDQICVPGYSQTVRNVTTSEKNAVYAEYGIASHTSGEYEVDHFVSLELGGSNDISNLWPEAASPTPGFHQKDKVENYLHEQVCAGNMTLAEAQREIATDWMAVYKQMGSP